MPIDLKNIASNLTAEAKGAALSGIREVLTEENTDKIIARLVEIIKGRLPLYLRWIPVGTVLDALLPGALLKVFEEVLSA